MNNRSLMIITLAGMILTGIGAKYEAQGQVSLDQGAINRPAYVGRHNNGRTARYIRPVNPQDTAGKALVRTVIGAGIGAGTGAIIGGRRGALIGATAGAVGGLIYHEAKVGAQRNRRRGW